VHGTNEKDEIGQHLNQLIIKIECSINLCALYVPEITLHIALMHFHLFNFIILVWSIFYWFKFVSWLLTKRKSLYQGSTIPKKIVFSLPLSVGMCSD
jgi:uncharacterized membrane protein